jgi:hypothetical protein
VTQSNASQDNVLTELKWVHGMVRRDLRACQDLAVAVAAGAPPVDIRARVRELQTGGPLFQLRVNCLQYCQFVHHHHALEDLALFPAVRKAAPQLGPAVDKLEADHQKVSGLLDQVESATSSLADQQDTPFARARLVQALNELATQLLEHLNYEETVLAPVLTQWKQMPFHA